MIRIVVVDDEPIARQGIVKLLGMEPDVEIVGEAASGGEAVIVIETLTPDAVFLDVQMPELDGFQVLEALALERLPIVVFVTAHDEFAIRAFEVNALDYLLKPFDRERLGAAMDRVRRHYRTRDADQLQDRLRDLLTSIPQRSAPDRLVVRDAGRVFFLPFSEIEWLEAAGNYVRVHTPRSSHLVRNTITRMAERLPAADFLRVSRSAIVSMRRVKEAQSLFNGCFVFMLQSGARIESSRRFRKQIAEALTQEL
jgi:two-component system, LytTR family, response regulator